MQKQIIVEVLPTGEVKIDALGFTGQACAKATALIEKALGTVTAKGRKPEFYRDQAQAQQQGH